MWPLADFRTELCSLNKELLFCFLDLMNTLVERPSAYARSVENVGVVARNMHYLLNALRGHQVSMSTSPWTSLPAGHNATMLRVQRSRF